MDRQLERYTIKLCRQDYVNFVSSKIKDYEEYVSTKERVLSEIRVESRR